MLAFMGVIVLYLAIALAFPLYAILSKSFQNNDGEFIGLANFFEYFNTPALTYSIQNSLTISLITTVVSVGIAFTLAYGLSRSCMPFKGMFRVIAMVPILVPSLLPGIGPGIPVRPTGHDQGAAVRARYLRAHRNRYF